MLAGISEEELKKVQKELNGQFPDSHLETYQADVSRPEEIKALVKKTTDVFDGIDVLVNAAGIYGPIGPSEKIDLAHWKKTFEVNTFGTFQMIREVAPAMQSQRKGKIINFSGGGDGPLSRFSAYSASKAAVVRLTETLAEEFKEYNIDINVIAPGAVNTQFLEQALAAGEELVGKERYQKLLKQKKEGGTAPELAASLCVFLASSCSDGLSGKFLSAVWDDWKNLDKEKIEKLMKNNIFTLRRVNPSS